MLHGCPWLHVAALSKLQACMIACCMLCVACGCTLHGCPWLHVTAMGKFRRVYSLICGSSPVPEKLTKEQKLQMALDMTSITENPFWSRVCDYNAVIAVGVTCFIIGFYA